MPSTTEDIFLYSPLYSYMVLALGIQKLFVGDKHFYRDLNNNSSCVENRDYHYIKMRVENYEKMSVEQRNMYHPT